MDHVALEVDQMPVSSDALLAQLDEMVLPYVLHTHVPLRTVEEAKQVEADLQVAGEKAFRIKNLYLRDRKKRNYLVTLEQDRAIDLKALGKSLGVGNLSFGSADRLMQNLGVLPGAVSPLAMVTGGAQGVVFYLDAAVQEAEVIYMHPLVNNRTIAVAVKDLLRFCARLGVDVHFLDLPST